jgi:hypothetical protein
MPRERDRQREECFDNHILVMRAQLRRSEAEREVLTKASCVWFVWCVWCVCVQPTSTVSPS